MSGALCTGGLMKEMEMAGVKLNTLRAGRKDQIHCAYEVVRSSAYAAGFSAGQKAANEGAAAKADLFRREMAAVLIELGNAIGGSDKAAMLDWYGIVGRVFAGGAGE